MNHNRIQKQLSAYLDDELSLERRTKVEAHLNTCHECVRMLSDFQQNRRSLGAWRHQVPSISHLVLSRLRDRGPVQRRCLPNEVDLRRWFFRPVTGGVFAFISACILSALVYFNLTPAADYSLDVYLEMHNQNSVYYLPQSIDENDSLDANKTISSAMPNDDTDFFLEVYLGD